MLPDVISACMSICLVFVYMYLERGLGIFRDQNARAFPHAAAPELREARGPAEEQLDAPIVAATLHSRCACCWRWALQMA